MPTPKLPCGCVDNAALAPADGRRGELCVQHVPRPRFWSSKDNHNRSNPWYKDNCCPYCLRVNSTGCACPEQYTYTCETCGLHSCDRLNMAHYKLNINTGLICPSTINKRTKAGKRDLKLLAAHPELNAVTAQFTGKLVTSK